MRVSRMLLCSALFTGLILLQSCWSPAGTVPSRADSSELPKERVWPELETIPKLPIGMNISELNYYTPSILFTDVMTTAGDLMSVHAGSGWDSGKIDRIPRDINGYPLSLPVDIDGNSSWVRFMINNHYSGTYRILFDGTGTLGASAYQNAGLWYVTLDGTGTHQYIDIETSASGDPVRNIRILPADLPDFNDYPLFLEPVVETLRPFHVIRFMDVFRTNFSIQRDWADRSTTSYFTQSSARGMAHEYAIALCNELDSDVWICVPHMASDDYIRQMAALWRDNLEPGLNIYLEYSNEVWNFGFAQFSWVNDNAVGGNYFGYPWPAARDAYVTADLQALSANPDNNFPEKNAYMMERTFRIWNQEFGSPDRVINVACGQGPWFDVTERVARYLDQNASGNARAEALSVGGYFVYTEADHNYWLANPTHATPSLMMDRVLTAQENNGAYSAWYCARETAKIARTYGLDFLVYEGGQHLQPFNQEEWPYNEALYAAQLHEKMYRMYLLNFEAHAAADVDCKLFIAWNFLNERKSKYGSWGHLENISQIGSDYSVTAPKFQALLDVNTPK